MLVAGLVVREALRPREAILLPSCRTCAARWKAADALAMVLPVVLVAGVLVACALLGTKLWPAGLGVVVLLGAMASGAGALSRRRFELTLDNELVTIVTPRPDIIATALQEEFGADDLAGPEASSERPAEG
jgi:hypothetical protein